MGKHVGYSHYKGLYNQNDGATDVDTWGLFYDLPPKEEVASLDSIRTEIRKLYRTNSLFHGMVGAMTDRVIGSGLELQSNVQTTFLKESVKDVDQVENRIEHLFTVFSKSKVDTTARFNFGEIQRQVYLNYLMMGEAFLIVDYRDGELRLQCVDPELCPLENGVEIDKSTGRVSLYRFKKNYESTELITLKPTADFNGVSIPTVIHYANTPRHEFYRGIPKLAPVINPIKQMNAYLGEEIAHARFTNKMTYVVKNPNSTFSPEQKEKIQRNMLVNLAKTNITLLDKDTDLTSIAPPQKKDNFKDFIQTLMTSICFNLLPQEVLFSDYDSNYSASRGAVMDSRQKIAITRNHFSDVVLNPVYEVFFVDLLTKNQVQAQGFFQDDSVRRAWLSSEWVGENVGHIDPNKEIGSIVTAIQNGLMSQDDGIKRVDSRKDFPKVIEALIKEDSIRKKAGLGQPKDPSPKKPKQEIESKEEPQL